MKPLRGHVVLVGLPGAGKSTVGRVLADRLGCEFLDFDEEITRRVGIPITEIFATKGEQYFRNLEAELTREMADRPAAVVAPGGGWVVQPGLVELLKPPAMLVHLRVSPGTAVSRMGREVAARPLVRGADPVGRVVTLWETRQQAYRSADFEVDADVLDAEGVASAILRLIDRSGTGGS